MAVTSLGMSITQMYRWYRENRLVVNRRYQRKLVWTQQEKQKLIDSILLGYPIPQFLLAQTHNTNDEYEIIDGMQRLNAIFSFIEAEYPLEDGRFFDVNEFASAKNYLRDENLAIQGERRLTSHECANLIEYQLAVTIFPAESEDDITDVFGRINSSGKHLSNQEKRQAGVISPFADLVRQVASEIRGDVSRDRLVLSEMPEISIDSRISTQGYRLQAEDTIWCKQGIIRMPHLRDSDDEEIIADIVTSILLDEPFERSKDNLDELYDTNSQTYAIIRNRLKRYSPDPDRLANELKATFSAIREIIETFDSRPGTFRKVVNPNAGGNAVKTEFYAVFMAVFNLIIRQGKTPSDSDGIMNALQNVHDRLERAGSNTVKALVRKQHIAVVTGLIQDYFVHREPPLLTHGIGLALEVENSIRRSHTETPRYEFKQGWLTLDTNSRSVSDAFIDRLAEHICAIANIGQDSEGYIFIGIADKKQDALRISELDGISPVQIVPNYDKHIVGIDREAKHLGISQEQYFDKLVNAIRTTKLTDPAKSDVLSHIDLVEIKGFSLMRIVIPKQSNVTYVGDHIYVREGSQTIRVEGQKLTAVFKRFNL